MSGSFSLDYLLLRRHYDNPDLSDGQALRLLGESRSRDLDGHVPVRLHAGHVLRVVGVLAFGGGGARPRFTQLFRARRFDYLASLVPEISMDTCRSGCMQATFFALLASLHSAAAVLGRVSPHALVLILSAATPLLTR